MRQEGQHIGGLKPYWDLKRKKKSMLRRLGNWSGQLRWKFYIGLKWVKNDESDGGRTRLGGRRERT